MQHLKKSSKRQRAVPEMQCNIEKIKQGILWDEICSDCLDRR